MATPNKPLKRAVKTLPPIRMEMEEEFAVSKDAIPATMKKGCKTLPTLRMELDESKSEKNGKDFEK